MHSEAAHQSYSAACRNTNRLIRESRRQHYVDKLRQRMAIPIGAGRLSRNCSMRTTTQPTPMPLVAREFVTGSPLFSPIRLQTYLPRSKT